MSSVDVASSSSDTKERLEKRFKDREDEYFTYEQCYVLIGTFNVNNRSAPANVILDEWLHRQIENSRRFPDIIAVGFQEIDTSSGAYIYDDRKKEDEWDQIIRRTIQTCYKTKDEKNRFQLINRVRLMGKREKKHRRSLETLVCFCRYSSLRLCSRDTHAQVFLRLSFVGANGFHGHRRQ